MRTIETLNDPPVDLLEAYGDREATIFGVTAPFSVLAGMCPLGRDDPRMTLDAINLFVVKVANEAGLEIEPEHEALFTQIAKEHGLERKFVINPITEQPLTAKDRVPRTAPAGASAPDTNNPGRPQNLHVPAYARAATETTITAPDERIERHRRAMFVEAEIVPHESQAAPEQVITPPVFTSPEPTLKVKAEVTPTDVRDAASAFTVTALSMPGTAGEFQSVQSDAEAVTEQLERQSPPQQMTIEDWQSGVEIAPPTPDSTSPQRWAEELAKSPLEIYDDFVDMLANFAEFPPRAEDHVKSYEPVSTEAQTEIPVAPQIVINVTERLAELDPDDRERAAPIIRDIAGAIHGLWLLESSMASPEAIAEVTAEAEALCIMLFEEIGVEYTQQDIEQFMAVLLHPEFQPPLPAEEAIEQLDLEHLGTREAKHFRQLVGSLVGPKSPIRNVLGTFALFCFSLPPRISVE